MSDMNEAATQIRTTVWDIPTRLFHWTLVAAVGTSIFTGEFGGMDIHVLSGLTILALVLFRLGWGFAGGRHARFANFVKGPKAALGYAKAAAAGSAPRHAGHNPLGGWSVVAMLLVVAAQAGTGLFANDDIMTDGPLVKFVSRSTSDFMSYLHDMNSKVLYVLIATHVAAVFVYLWKGENLIRPMLTGWKTGFPKEETAGDARGSLILALFLAAVAAGIAYAIKTI